MTKVNNYNIGEHIVDQDQQRKLLVSGGMDLILSLFTQVGQQRLFPRAIMTKYTNGQIIVHNKEQIMSWFERANYQDCRINAYPAFVSNAEEQDYKRGINLDIFAPNILFIDLDANRFKSDRELQPYTFNSKCAGEGKGEVRIIQRFDNFMPLPNTDNLLIEFQTFLIDRKLSAEIKQEKKRSKMRNISNRFPTNNVQGLSDADSFDRIREWGLRCNEVRELEPSGDYFVELIKKSIKRARETGIKPLRFEETLRYKNQELYDLLHQSKSNINIL